MRRLERLAVALLMCVACGAMAQLSDQDPGWKETPVPPPPAIRTSGLLQLDMGRDTALKFGVDPASLVISKDGVVRYVMVASSASGAMNAMYEGIRCATGEFKTYARATTAGQWNEVQDPQWRSLYDNGLSRHALALANQGACIGRTTARSVGAIVKALKPSQQPQHRYY
ncbi:MAG: CNP1-like family protein [Rhodoferax sp.]